MRRANCSGSIYRMKGVKRRTPWRVRITSGWEIDKETGKSKQIVKTIGYYRTREEAEAALVAYKDCPYDLTTKNMTFKELYEIWSEEYFKKLTGVSSERTVISAYNYSSTLYNMKMRDIRVYHLQECMENAFVIPTQGKEKGKRRYASAGTKARMKSMFNLMFDFAYARDVVDKNYARAFDVGKEIRIQQYKDKRKNIPFSNEEIEILWSNINKIQFVDMVLIGIFSGWRPQELSILRLKDINLENNTMFGGLKTDAGRNRCVPIHPFVRELVVTRYNDAKESGSKFLFNDFEGQQGTHMTYDKYRGRFDKIIKRLGMQHHPHETRHTFITKAKKFKMDEYLLKRIVGHSIPDVTEYIYTHREIEELREAMEMIKE